PKSSPNTKKSKSEPRYIDNFLMSTSVIFSFLLKEYNNKDKNDKIIITVLNSLGKIYASDVPPLNEA
ncbi:hypothetical protein N8Z56_02285, partial [Pelagibacteraceae bacterium]|nr:hypothetical protein [Pelagibacteraceae bacterium]